MRRLAVVLVVAVAAACGGSKSDPPKQASLPAQNVGDPAGQRAFSGSFRTGVSAGAQAGTCTVLVPPAGTGAQVTTATCATGGTTVNLTGTYTAALVGPRPEVDEVVAQAAAGAGTVILTGSGATWVISAQIGATPAGVGVLSGTITVSGNAATLVLTDATVDPVTTFCGTYAEDAATSTPVGAFLLQVNSTVAQGVVASYDGGFAAILAGGRSGASLDISACDFTLCVPVAAGSMSGTASASGRWTAPGVSNPGPTDRGPWSGTTCPGAAASVTCCGTGAKTRCCIGVSCACTPAP